MNLSEIERIEAGRCLGADFAASGLQLPLDVPSSVREGFEATGRSHRGPPPADRFLRKWLQIRLNALRRGRAVDPNVTVAHLREIDQAICPVTLVQLTHGELLDTDWSIDRLNNDGAYADGNLAVLSVRANKAKGSLSYDEVRRRSMLAEPVDGLTPREWYRMACVMYGACHAAPADGPQEWLPLATFIPSRSTWTQSAMLQQTLLRASATSRSRNQFCKALRSVSTSDNAHERLVRTVERLHYLAKGHEHRYDALLDPGIQAEIEAWLRSLRAPQVKALRKLLAQMHGGESLAPEKLAAWSLRTRGYSA
jgi:hypothetical protein